MTEEYIRVMRELWRNGRSSFKGQYYTLDDCECFPTPNRDIPIVSAGQSPKGVKFTATFAEYNFVFGNTEKLKRIARPVQDEAARLGRNVGTLALVTIVAAETDAEAERQWREVVAGADEAAIRNIVRSASMDSNPDGTSKHFLDGLSASVEDGNLAFTGFPVIHGSYQSVAQQIMAQGRETGISGMLLTFADFVPGVKAFGERILPIIRAAQPETAAA
jgi:pyrimidine oxygenase